jgi:hypothetical protein
MSIVAFDIEQYYRQIFGGKPYKIGKEGASPALDGFTISGTNAIPSGDQYSDAGHLLKTSLYGIEIWLPVKFFGLKKLTNLKFSFDELLLAYTTVSVSVKKTMIETPLVERSGSVKELFNVDDYMIEIKGFLIDENRVWPEKELNYMRALAESDQSIGIDNALTNIYLADKGQQVVIKDFKLPEVSGGRKHVRPFSMQLASDNIFELIIE